LGSSEKSSNGAQKSCFYDLPIEKDHYQFISKLKIFSFHLELLSRHFGVMPP